MPKVSTKKPAAKKEASIKELSDLPKELFGAKVNEQLIAQAVRVYLANQREGSAKTKTRGEVEGSTRKIYRQKGTGKARHGSIRAPIFVGGGIVFGPLTRDYRLKLTKAMKRVSLISALSSKKSDTVVLEHLDNVEPKTKQVSTLLSNNGLSQNVLLVVPGQASLLKRAARNLRNVDCIEARNLNPYAVLTHKKVVFTKKSLKESMTHFGKTL